MNTSEQLLERLFYIDRSIIGIGARTFLAELSRELPLREHTVKSGERCFDWTVPDEWVLKKGRLYTMDGKVILDAADNILHILNYSSSFSGIVTRDELASHCHYSEQLPDAIPYRTSYYASNWGFCLPFNQFQHLTEDRYKVDIESEFIPSELRIGEATLKGSTDREVVFTSYYCHPLQANDGLSGIVLLAHLYDLLKVRDLKYTYRFFFLPETIGSLALLAKEIVRPNLVEYAMVATCVGTGEKLNYKRTFKGNHSIDHIIEEHLKTMKEQNGVDNAIRNYVPIGSDERQFSSPGIGIPTCSLMRAVYGEFPEYHTSKDNLELVAAEHIIETAQIYRDIILEYERYPKLQVTVAGGEPFLTKYHLHQTIGGKVNPESQIINNWIFHMADGTKNLKDIAVKSGYSEETLRNHLTTLVAHNLVKYI